MNQKKQMVWLMVAAVSTALAQQGAKEVMPVASPKTEASFGPGIDTLDVESGGNWLQKRVIWEDAQRKYEKIQEAEHRALEARMFFFEKRGASDKAMNVFYAAIGFGQGEIDEIVDTLLATVERMKDPQGTTTDKEKEIQAKLYTNKNELEQLKSDIKFMTDLDAALDNALMQLVNQVTLVNDYERQAWQKFKDIGLELDDRKAKEYYLQMDALEKNIQAIEAYLKGQLKDYFDKVIGQLDEYMVSVKAKLDKLQQSGIELKNQVAELEAAKKMGETPSTKKTTWADRLSAVWRYPISWISGLFSWLMSFIWGGKK